MSPRERVLLRDPTDPSFQRTAPLSPSPPSSASSASSSSSAEFPTSSPHQTQLGTLAGIGEALSTFGHMFRMLDEMTSQLSRMPSTLPSSHPPLPRRPQPPQESAPLDENSNASSEPNSRNTSDNNNNNNDILISRSGSAPQIIARASPFSWSSSTSFSSSSSSWSSSGSESITTETRTVNGVTETVRTRRWVDENGVPQEQVERFQGSAATKGHQVDPWRDFERAFYQHDQVMAARQEQLQQQQQQQQQQIGYWEPPREPEGVARFLGVVSRVTGALSRLWPFSGRD